MGKWGKEKIKISAFSDIHGLLDGIEEEIEDYNPNIIVIAGDLHPCLFGMDADKWFTTELFPLLEKMGKPVIITPGNHDFWLKDVIQGAIAVQFPPNVHLLCEKSLTIDGIKFYGTPWVPWIDGRWCWEGNETMLEEVYAKIPKDVDVIISHTPPLLRNKTVDISLEHVVSRQRHFGSMALTKAIKEINPKVVICGHIHTGKHKGVSVGEGEEDNCKTICYNVSRVDEHYQIAFPITEIEL